MSRFSPAVLRRGTFDFHLTTQGNLDYIEWTGGEVSRALLCLPEKPTRPLAHTVFNVGRLLYEVHACEDGRTFRIVSRHVHETEAWAAMMTIAHAACGSEAHFIRDAGSMTVVGDEMAEDRHNGRLIASLPHGYGIIADKDSMPWFGRPGKPLYVLRARDASCIQLCLSDPEGKPRSMDEPLASFEGPNKEEAALASLFTYPYEEVRLSGHQQAELFHRKQHGLLAMRQAGGLLYLGSETG